VVTSGSEDMRDEVEGEDEGGAHEPFETLRQAAKAVAAAAAVGAAVGAARAFTTRDGGEEDEEREHADAEAQGEKEQAEEEDESPAAAAAPREEDQLDEAPEPEEKDSEPERAPTAERHEPAQVERRENGADENGSVEDGAKPLHGESLEETTEVVRRAHEQLRALQGREPESISSLARTDGGWTATFEMVELERVPNSMDVMASYEIVLDEQKNMVRYSKARRYYRGHADREGGA
jgi:gas vesicle protein GvpO